ncbi:alpha/beta hydrolase [Dokdonia sp. Hel_I_53]|uniref:alpha/beta hydrolase n=1 Tax=Dokdonia sp. Hel_I_53 TaxID=1566287 RepID=UPI001198DB50|nr:alpha/beta hydrolase [Dokdonia sp. Hel_I_53]TVZ51567.1 hypothetical protein OD90_0714 [Dokdonia sp. Hel_I_53]
MILRFLFELLPTKWSFFAALLCTSIISVSQEYGGNEELRINSNVYGTLLTPDQPTTTLAIIIPGSGPTDRNGNQQMARSNTLKLLAEGLAQKGIASYRYDKRVLTLLKQNALREDKLSFDMFIDDAISTVSFFKEEGRFSNIYIIGHSQGSLVGMVAAQKTSVDGYVSLAGAGQSIDNTIVNQIALQMPDLEKQAINAFKTLKEEGAVKDFSPALNSILRPSLQPFMRSWMVYDPQAEIAKLEGENVLILTGDNDVQVSLEEAHLLQEGNSKATLIVIDGMNHVLRIIKGDDLENTKSYNQPNLPLAPEVVNTIAQFILD